MPHRAPRVATEAGIYSGRRQQSDLPAPVVAFRAIPYAAPPVGSRRWRPPAPPAKFADVRPAVEPGYAPPQPPGGDYNFRATARLSGLPESALVCRHNVQHEDCLHLNVWTPDPDPGALRPVLVWLHGGAHIWSSASPPKYDGALFAAEQNVVVVSVEFRLGILGLLAHPGLAEESSDGLAGNLTLRDQIAALGWIRRNIVGFGGDPENVTLFGVSAGARNILELTVSPAAEGLFDRVIVQSPWDGDHHQRRLQSSVGDLESALDLGERLGEELGCGRGPQAIDKMRELPVEQIVRATLMWGDPTEIWSTIIDGALVPDDPLSLLERGEFRPVPMIAGCAGDEADLFLVEKMPLEDAPSYRGWVRQSFGERAQELLRIHPEDDVRRSLAALWGDRSFVVPAWRAACAATQHGTPAYFYCYTHTHPQLSDEALKDTGKRIGAFHASELPVLFGTLEEPLDEYDLELGRILRSAWASFAADGDPGIDQWERFSPERGNCLEIDIPLRSVDAWRRERIEAFVGAKVVESA